MSVRSRFELLVLWLSLWHRSLCSIFLWLNPLPMSGRMADTFQHHYLVLCQLQSYQNEKFFDCICLVSCYCRYCYSYCEDSVSVFGRHGCTTINTLHGFNTVFVVGLFQIFVLINKAFPIDKMICHGVHYFPSLAD